MTFGAECIEKEMKVRREEFRMIGTTPHEEEEMTINRALEFANSLEPNSIISINEFVGINHCALTIVIYYYE